MARLDSYLKSIERFSAAGLVLKSNAHILLRFATGDRYATQTTPHDILQELVRGVVPSAMRLALDTGTRLEFVYACEGTRYHIAVVPGPTEWTVTVDPAGAAAATEAAATAPAESLQIERHQYSEPPGSRRSGPASPAGGPRPGAAPGAAVNPALAATVLGAPPGLVAPAPPAASPVAPASVADRSQRSTAPPITGNQGERWIDRVLTYMKQQGASDLHLAAGSPPYLRLHGDIMPIEGEPVLEGTWLLEQIKGIAPETNLIEFEQRNDTDFAYAIPGLSRFRVNVFRDRNGPGAVLRTIPFQIPTAQQLGLGPALLDLCNLTKGLVVVTGPTGSGKSTTLAALIDHINRTRRAHIITIEDPVEFVHPNKLCLVNQREVHTHTRSFKDALRAALREDPDIVLVGEMRDLETIAIAVETAETGHLVFGTLHTSTAPSTVERIVDQFPPDRQEQIRQMLAKSLRGVIAQVLCKKQGGGRIAAYEVLIGTSAVENLIREGKAFQLFSLMQTGKSLGMQTMNDALLELVKAGQVEASEAYLKAINKIEFKNSLERAGLTL